MAKYISGTALFITSLFLALSFHSVNAADSMNDWQKAVAERIASKQTYPRSAVAREIEGRAQVRLSVDPSGEITNYEVVKPTGEDVLDREIPKLIKHLSPLPSLPAGQDSITFIMPLTWSLD